MTVTWWSHDHTPVHQTPPRPGLSSRGSHRCQKAHLYCVHLTQKGPKMEYNKDVCGDVLIAGLRENPALFNAGFQENL